MSTSDNGYPPGLSKRSTPISPSMNLFNDENSTYGTNAGMMTPRRKLPIFQVLETESKKNLNDSFDDLDDDIPLRIPKILIGDVL